MFMASREVVEMEICVSASADSLDASVDPRFARCPYSIIVDLENMNFKAIPNIASTGMSGAGIRSTQNIASRVVKVVITGNVGPNAFQALSEAGIKIVIGVFGTVREVAEKYRRGELNEPGTPTVSGHFEMDMGRRRSLRWRC